MLRRDHAKLARSLQFASAFEPLFEIIPRLVERFRAPQWLRLGERMTGLLEQEDAVAQDVDEEIAAEPKLLVHVVEAVIDRG